MTTVLVYSEKIKLAAELVSAAKLIDSAVYAVSINNNELAQALSEYGIKVLKIVNPDLSLADTAAVASALKQAVDKVNAETVLLASNRKGKEVAGRLSQMLQAGCLTDVNKLTVSNGAVVGTRNALGGATIAEQTITTAKKIIAISAKSFETATAAQGGSISELEVQIKPSVKVVEIKEKSVESVDITAASTLVAIGQGLDEKDQIATVEVIAKALGGVVACSKPVATDKKWLSEERIIGISGSKCKPELAFLLGISGQVQFAVGIRDAKTIVAINKDENAPICELSDYILIADLNEVLPELKKALA
jgi:electron transfer flavoprotein alpha subunit